MRISRTGPPAGAPCHTPSGMDDPGAEEDDARLAALMHVHGIEYVMTFNRDDFAGFEGIKMIVPGAAAP